MQGKPLTNVSALQTHPTRLSPDEVLQHVAATYRLPVDAILNRSHRDTYQTAVYLLRRAANEPLQTVAMRFRISPSRISNIQKAIERAPRSPQQTQLFATSRADPIFSPILRNMVYRSKKRQPSLVMPMGSTGTIPHIHPMSSGSNDLVNR